MKHLTKILIAFCLFGFGELQAQNAVVSGGGEASGTGGISSYTIGQAAYTTKTGTSGKITEGIQQPFEILVVSSKKGTGGISLECTAYPNPVTTGINLAVKNYNNDRLQY